jgi:hypothetical protein
VSNGNISLVNSTATTGNILKAGSRFIHNFGIFNTFVGVNAGNLTMTGDSNSGIGVQALASVTDGYNNTASGYRALFSNTSGILNTASGSFALNSNTGGGQNTANGAGALQNNTTGYNNTASGAGTLASNSDGFLNTASGSNALINNTSGNYNTAIGIDTLFNNTIGITNTAIGARALYSVTNGLDNIGLGFSAGLNITGDHNIAIGNLGFAAESNTIRIGNVNHTRVFFSGIRGIMTAGAAVPVLIDGSGQLGTTSSSRRFKDDIADMDASSSALMRLRPVTFHYKSDRNAEGRTLQYGLIAEEVAEVYPGLVARSADGQVETVMYQYLPAMLLNEYQKQDRRIAAQATHIAELERDRLAQTAEIAGLKASVAEIAELKQHLAHLARLLDQQRNGTVTAGLDLK